MSSSLSVREMNGSVNVCVEIVGGVITDDTRVTLTSSGTSAIGIIKTSSPSDILLCTTFAYIALKLAAITLRLTT